MVAAMPSPRWGQLTYSSFDRNDGTGGGWQVKDITGDLDSDEQELLRSRVQTQFDSGVDLPRFPTPAELAELPRRLVYAPAAVRSMEAASWHHVPAGVDASGRPGNVFAHVVLDRNPDAPDPRRPIERWRSPDWLTPFGPEAVLEATLTSPDPPRPGPLNPETVGSWLFAPRQWRMQTLAVLLDAVRAAFTGGPLVVVPAADDEGTNWIAAVSWAMSAGTARRFYCSTLERPATLAQAANRGLHLVCVPRADLSVLQRREDIVVVDPAGEIELGDLDGAPHRTARGDRIEVGEWSVLAQELFTDVRAFTDAITEIDEVAHRVGDSGLDPAWPMAMVVSRRPGAESTSEAGRVMAACAPPQLRAVPELYAAAVASLRADVSGSVERAWDQVIKLGAEDEPNPPTIAGEVAVGVYAEVALADASWLGRPGPARLPSTHYFSPAPDPQLVQLANTLCDHIPPVDPAMSAEVTGSRAGLHFVELALRLGLAHDETLAQRLWQVCQRSILPVLADSRAGTLLADSVERMVAHETRHWLWSQLVAATLPPGPPGERLSGAVLDALGPSPDDPDPLQSGWEWLSDHPHPEQAAVSPLLGELAWHRVRGGDRGLDVRFFAVWSVLAAMGPTPNPQMLAQAEQLLSPPWDIDRLTQLQLRWADTVPMEWFVRALSEAPLEDPAAGYLSGELAGGEGPVSRFARTREALASPDWVSVEVLTAPAYLEGTLRALTDGLAIAHQQGAAPDAELLRRADGLVALGLLAARSRARGVADPVMLERSAGLLQAAVARFSGLGTGFSAAEVGQVIAWCDWAGISSTALTELFLLADPRSMLRSPEDRVAGWLHAIPTGEPDSAPITAAVVAARLAGTTDSRDRTEGEVWAALRSTPGSSDERALRHTERFLHGWLRQAQTGRVRR